MEEQVTSLFYDTSLEWGVVVDEAKFVQDWEMYAFLGEDEDLPF